MAIISPYRNKRILIIDDVAEMRSSIRSQVSSLGVEQTSVAATVRDALDLLKTSNRFDIILCDYYLGGATDGQQFLEYIRSSGIISRATLFLMITAEQGYTSVITAAECLPDDYLLKPFTADALKSRIDRLLDKKQRLARIDKLQDQGRWQEMIAACDEIIAARDKYLLDAMRIKGNALLMTNRFDEAIEFYRRALQMRSMPWAKLGLAKAYQGSGQPEQAKLALNELLAETPRFLAAYDALGRLHRECGEADDALRILDKACELSPNALARHRAIAGIAEEAADFGRVEKALRTVVQKTRNSPLRDLGDYASLGNALTELGDTEKAIALITEAKTSFRNVGDTTLLAAVEAVAQHKAGNPELAQQALERAMQGGAQGISEAAKLAVAKACLVHGRQDEAEQMLKDVVQNNPDQSVLHASITQMMKTHGNAERAEYLVSNSNAEVIQINDEAVRKGQSGDFRTAAAMLREAAERLPGNLQIVANAAYALLLDVYTNGVDADKLRDAHRYHQMLLAKDQRHPRLGPIAALLAKIQRKFKLPVIS
ncbi:MAG: tetratricopeptide repeat protein [Candidatus Accumulibacter phosphatis]|jgi:tetratricopeptide (TPR) repeat protein|nr:MULTISPECIES: tetratricopeptide repeat protein [Candidatus Accumulibacter]MBL8406227.1 tetratricopeptide repeat protein [Accumulibacter sp.]NMQ03890.1 response regulator [Candidatus Accumulibacter contiguus]HRF10919.1 tetratricopeptide repeat protein [Candidatus Accumulibacter phosphatis]